MRVFLLRVKKVSILLIVSVILGRLGFYTSAYFLIPWIPWRYWQRTHVHTSLHQEYVESLIKWTFFPFFFLPPPYCLFFCPASCSSLSSFVFLLSFPLLSHHLQSPTYIISFSYKNIQHKTNSHFISLFNVFDKKEERFICIWLWIKKASIRSKEASFIYS